MLTKNDLEETLYKAFRYAVQRKSFTKMGLLKQAENVCVYGLGRYHFTGGLKKYGEL